jgi:predicted KAP-like P-loop ATPase
MNKMINKKQFDLIKSMVEELVNKIKNEEDKLKAYFDYIWQIAESIESLDVQYESR